METEAEKAEAAPGGTTKRRRSRWVPGIPRRRRKGREPWQIQALQGLLPVGVVVGFLALGMVLAVVAYDATGSETISVFAGGIGLGMAVFLTPRVAACLLDYFS